ncbi:ArsR/SmtB family transcription factor [Haloferax sp. YSSS75]|uniref:ArsR/SmtB family transcription factor n=1 Tax=Haloferax sp. YSSS75 TaxID=3388564 RepID=UPI00398CF7D8
MADLIPSITSDPDPDREDRDPRVIGLDSDEADELLGAISSSTARTILASLHEAPATPSELATVADTSLQNVQYHLGNLSESGLIEVTGTRYSEKGREMNVYAPSDRALVVVAGRDEETRGLKGALKRLIGGVGVLGIGAAVLNRLAQTGTFSPFALGGASGGGDGGAAGGAANESTTSDVSVSYTGDSGDVNATATEQARTLTETATEASGDDGYSIAEATTTESAETTAEATRTVAETATQTPTPIQTEEPATTAAQTVTETAAQTVTETAAQVTSGSPGFAEFVGSLSPGALFFLGGMTVLVAWVAVGLLRD